MIAILALIAAAAAPALGQEADGTIGGKATLVDGDTVKIYGRNFRIFGIDAPKRGEPGFGTLAEFMRAAAEKGPFFCDVVDKERNEPEVAVCWMRVDFVSEDLAESLLERGLVKTHPGYRRLRPSLIAWYEEVEAQARKRCRGLWRGLPECRGHE